MDIDQIQHLTNEQKQTYLDLERLFDSPGWAIVEKFAKDRHDALTFRLITAKSWDENRVFTGGREAFGLVANLRESTEAEFTQIAASNAASRRDVDEEENE